MNDYQDGEKGPGPCGYCNKVVPITFIKTTLSLCEGLEEVENSLVLVCDECGNITGIPAQSLPRLQQAYKKLVESGAVSDYCDITTELKSIVDARKSSNKSTKGDDLQGEPLETVAG